MTKRIRITQNGVFNSQGRQVPKGTEVDVPDDFNGWRGKYELVNTTQGKTFEVATPSVEPEPEPEPDPETDNELEAVRAEYEAVTGEKPHGRKKLETLREEIEAARRGGQDD